MPEIGLDRARVVAIVRQLITAGMPQHVGMAGKSKPARSLMRLMSRLIASGVNGCRKICRHFSQS